jgi:hypothetical protein
MHPLVLPTFKCSDTSQNIATEIRKGTACTLSNGSFMETFTAAAILIEGDISGVSMNNTVLALGAATDMSAYQGEMVGIYATTQLVCLICNFHKVATGSIHFGCDRQSALMRAFLINNNQQKLTSHVMTSLLLYTSHYHGLLMNGY